MPYLEKEYAEKLKKDYNLEVFIETGTYKGATIFNMEDIFDELHTIEFGKELYENLVSNYKGSKINFYNGDSSEKIVEILEKIKKKPLFFLDAHYSAGDTSGSFEDVPLLGELLEIVLWNKPCVIIVDDVRIFGTKDLNVKREEIISIVKEKMVDLFYLPSYLDKNDRMVIVIE